MDYGATVHGYATDVTRTFPANGRFSPEQRKLHAIDSRADIYSVGMVLAELFTLRTPMDEPVAVAVCFTRAMMSWTPQELAFPAAVRPRLGAKWMTSPCGSAALKKRSTDSGMR